MTSTWLHRERLEAAHRAVQRSGACTVLDLGCGNGDLLRRLTTEPQIERIVGVDLCRESLGRLQRRISALDGGPKAQVDLVHACMTEGTATFKGFDCAVMVETIEHVDPNRLSALERAVFHQMRPATVVVTTPNAEFNPLLGVPPHRFRHGDHCFEWDRGQFRRWARSVAGRNHYAVDCRDIAGCHPALGGASQMAVFTASERPRSSGAYELEATRSGHELR